MSVPAYILGVDGGGTKTVVVLADREGRQLGRSVVGPTNPNVVGSARVAEHLLQGIAQCCETASCSPSDIGAAVLGIAGSGSPANRQALERGAREILGAEVIVRVESDARIAVEGALGGREGVVVIAGTGSVVCIKETSGAIHLRGGWGRVIGDGGSGYDIGVEALRAVTDVLDGMETAGLLTDSLQNHLGWRNRGDVLESLSQHRVECPTLAPFVLDAAEKGDVRALAILRQGAAQLRRILVPAIPIVQTRPVTVATCGGLIDHDTVYRRIVVEHLCSASLPVEIIFPRQEAVEGALLLAREELGDRV